MLAKLFPYAEDKSFSFLICAVLFVPLVFSHFTYEKFETIKIIVLSLFVGAALITHKQIKYNSLVSVCVGIFLSAGLMATIFTQDRVYSFLGRDYIWMGLYFFILWSTFLILLISSLNKEKLLYLLKILILVGLVNSLLSIIQTFGIGVYYNVYLIGHLVRPPALLGNPNVTGMFLSGTIVLSVYFWSVSVGLKAKIYYGLSAVVCTWALMLVASRAGILGLLASLFYAALFVLFTKNKNNLIYLGIIGLLAATFYFIFTPLLRTDLPGLPTDVAQRNIVHRLETWDEGLRMLAKNPFTGVGWGSHDEVHNVFLNFLVIGGAPLLIGFVLILVAIVWKNLKQTQWLDTVLVSSLVGILVSASFNPVASSVWVMLAVILAGIFIQVSPKFKIISIKKLTIPIGTIFVLVSFCFLASQYLLFVGLRAENDRKYTNSYNNIRNSLIFNPFNSIAKANLLYNKIQLGYDVQEIEEDIKKDINRHPNNEWSFIRSGVLYNHLFLKTNNEKYYQKSLNSIRTAMLLNPYRYGSTLGAAYAYNKNDYAQAKEFSLAGVMAKEDYQQNYYSWLVLTNIYLESEDYDAAKYALGQAYKIILNDTAINTAKPTLKRILLDLETGKKPSKISLPPVSDITALF